MNWLRHLLRRISSPPTARQFDPDEAAFVANPYPTFAHLRQHDPVHRSPGGAYVLTRYQDVLAALGDERLGNAPARHALVHARNRARYICADVANNIVPFLDPPEHGSPRRILGRAFHQQLRNDPPDLAAIATGLLDDCDARGPSFDVVRDYGSPFALQAIAAMLGLPIEAAPQLKRWSESFFRLFAPLPSEAVRVQLDEHLQEARTYLLAQLADRRASPRHDVLSKLAASREGWRSDLQLVDNVLLLLADGIENVDRAIGNSVQLLLRHRHQRLHWQRQPELLAKVVDECLRFESPAQFMARVALDDLTMHGVRIPRDAVVLLVLGSANRDSEVFASPDRFEIERSSNPHLAFGQGRHACVGGPLVELELATALRVLFERHPRIRQIAPCDWLHRPGHRWVDRVMVKGC